METIEYLNRHYGISFADIKKLQGQARKLHGFYERCCNDISYNEETEQYELYCRVRGTVIGTYPDIEKACIKRIEAILKNYPELGYYLQTDPRGTPLYVFFKREAEGKRIDSFYSSIGCYVPIRD